MASLNQVNIVGRVGQDPVTRTLQDGSIVVTFSIATSEKYNGEERTEWHNIVVYKQAANFATQYIHKGDLVHVFGKLQYRKWTDKEGAEHQVTEILARQVQSFAQKRKDTDTRDYQRNDQRGSGNGGTRPRIKSRAESEYETNHGDLPFSQRPRY